jgi:2-keto-4-pentenoate hydratase/2-oxohepta-3-ene-1,7-dioic acid hydratase in catechol pathway
VAGLAVGQDVSERIVQMASTPPQFSMGKSYPRFGPVGPWLVTPDEFANPDDLELGCAINGEQVQKGRTRDLIFDVAALIEQLSAITPLLPGDLIFTGTPAGVGLGRKPATLAGPGRCAGQLHRRHRRTAAPFRRRVRFMMGSAPDGR